jgi:hypothetical protein
MCGGLGAASHVVFLVVLFPLNWPIRQRGGNGRMSEVCLEFGMPDRFGQLDVRILKLKLLQWVWQVCMAVSEM